MTQKCGQPMKVRTTRWIQLLFPQELIVDEAHVLSRKRHFPAFWVVKEESIPLSKVASIQIVRGLLFSSIVIENSGGPFPITIKGISNRKALTIRRTLESHDLSCKDDESRKALETEKTEENEKKTNGILTLLKKSIKTNHPEKLEMDEPLEIWWKETPEWENERFDPTVLRDEDSFLDEPFEKESEKSSKAAWINDLVKQPSKTIDDPNDW